MKEEEFKNDLRYDINERPPIMLSIVLALQHVFAMFGATVLVPILVNKEAGMEVLPISVALFGSGIGTLIYQFITKRKSPVYLGSSFSFIIPVIIATKNAGPGAAYTAIMVVGILYVLIAFVIKMIGMNWIEKLFPPIIIGPMIAIIGLGLASTAVEQMGLSGNNFDWRNLVVSIVTFLSAAIISLKGKGFTKIIPFLVALVVGFITSMFLGLIDLTTVKEATFFSIPNFKIAFVDYNLDFSFLIAIIPVSLVTISEHIGDHSVLSNIVNKNLLKDPGLHRTLIGDGIATFFSAFIGGPANTTYGENTGVIGLTRIASTFVVCLAAIFAIILAFFNKFIALIACIPDPVFGGISILLFGLIASNGLRVLIDNQVDFSKNRNLIICSAMLVIGLGGAVIQINSVSSLTGMGLSAIVGILLNIILPKEE